jgi:hypothetical protein
MRMEPPPSLACAIGAIPAATADADPPLDPPHVTSPFQGLWQGPKSRGSVVGSTPNSGVLVFPRITRPARLSRATSSLSFSGTKSFSNRDPDVNRTPP